MKILENFFFCLFPEWNDSLFTALAYDSNIASSHIDACRRKFYEFRNSHAGRVEQIQHSGVAYCIGRFPPLFMKKLIYFVNSEIFGKKAMGFGEVHHSRWVGIYDAFCQEEAKKSTKTGKPSGITAGSNSFFQGKGQKLSNLLRRDLV